MPKFSVGRTSLSTSIEMKVSEDNKKPGTKRKRPEGRKRAKEEHAQNEHYAKKLEMAPKALEFQKKQLPELETNNFDLLFPNGPRGVD